MNSFLAALFSVLLGSPALWLGVRRTWRTIRSEYRSGEEPGFYDRNDNVLPTQQELEWIQRIRLQSAVGAPDLTPYGLCPGRASGTLFPEIEHLPNDPLCIHVESVLTSSPRCDNVLRPLAHRGAKGLPGSNSWYLSIFAVANLCRAVLSPRCPRWSLGRCHSIHSRERKNVYPHGTH